VWREPRSLWKSARIGRTGTALRPVLSVRTGCREEEVSMTPDRVGPLLALADDLSGAAETAAVLMSRTSRTDIVLVPPSGDCPQSDADVVVADLDDRDVDASSAAARTKAVLASGNAGPGSRRILLKFDSLLRGNVAAKVAVLRDVGGVVCAPALPAFARVVRGGVLTVGGTALKDTAAWAAQGRPAPESVAEALSPLPTVVLDLATVRGPALPAALTRALRDGRVPICDGEDDRDLDAVADALASLPPDLGSVALAGSAGVAAAIGRTLVDAPDRSASSDPVPPRGLLVVVGTAEPTAAEQVARLLDTGAREVRIPLPSLLASGAEDGRADDLAAAVADETAAGGVVVVRPDPDAARDVASSRRISSGLGALVARALAPSTGPVGLVLTGGETARRVLDALRVGSLTPIGQVHHGAVVSRAPDGRTVVTRPGSFGGPESLCSIVAALRRPHTDGSPIDPPAPAHSPAKHHGRQ
jgi:uncharacterized protein YgbK (DUF1537 family)